MNGFVAICKRELFALFVTPLAWVLLFVFLLLQGLHFYVLVSHFATQPGLAVDGGPVQAFFGQTVLVYLPMLFVCPLLTMRAFAEERRSGTIEALLTAPVGSAGVVLGKYVAALVTYVVLWVPTTIYFGLLSRIGEIDWKVVGTGYLGVLLTGATYLAVGLFASAMARSQLVAAMLAFLAVAGLFTLGLGEFVFSPGPLRDLAGYVSVWSAMNELSRGLVDSRRIVFAVTSTAAALFATVRTVESWRWG
jgi:ABC-2 type transport system permease protein